MTTGSEYLAVVDAVAPDLIVGAHVVGSTVLDDFIPGVSDLDLVCELSGPPNPETLANTLPADLDVIFVRSGELTKGVQDARTLAWGRDGVLHTEDQGALVPVLWEQLRSYAKTLRGTPPDPPVGREEVARYCRDNLETYWRPLLSRVKAGLVEAESGTLGPQMRWVTVWLASGPPRLWHTFRTGQIVSKSVALRLAGEHWTDLSEPLAEISMGRRDAERALTRDHANVAVALTERVLAEMWDCAVPGPA